MANSSNRGGSRPGAGRKKKNPDGTYEHAAFSAEQLKELTDSPHVAYAVRGFFTREAAKCRKLVRFIYGKPASQTRGRALCVEILVQPKYGVFHAFAGRSY